MNKVIVGIIKMIHMMSKMKRFNMSTIIKVKEAMLQINNNGDHKETKEIRTTKTTKEIGVVATTIIKSIGVIKAIGEAKTKAGGTITKEIGGGGFSKAPDVSTTEQPISLSFSWS